jgi:hypothetical protein
MTGLIAVLQRTSPDVRPKRSALRRDILDLVTAVGRGKTAKDRLFRSFDEGRTPHRKHATAFRKVAVSSSPLEEKDYSGQVRIELDRQVRRRWTTRARVRANPPPPAGLRGLTSGDLTTEQLADVKSAALHLAVVHDNEVRRQQPNKVDQDALISGLALIFVEHAGLDTDHHRLPHSVGSFFIQFCRAAVQPFFGDTEMSAGAIAQRWKRIKEGQPRKKRPAAKTR